jgi:glucarate dehydratase
MATHGFRVLKLKGGVLHPSVEVATLAALRERFGPEVKVRIDPQANWTYTTALEWWPRLREIGLEYLEDPIWGLEAMARLRRELTVPFATNMCVVDPDTLQIAIRLLPVDIVLADPHRWGGLLATKKLAAVAETMGWGLSIHSAAELGISTAACLHLASSTPCMRFALDTHYPHQVDDIITEPFRFVEGRLTVPSGPGLGITLDEEKLARYAEVYKKQANTSIPAHMRDPFRPDAMPKPY